MADIWMDVDTALSEVPVNIMPLVDDTDFKTVETAVAYDGIASGGITLEWNFVTTAGAFSSVAVTPTTGGVYDWNEHAADSGMYSIEIPASGGGTINNDTEGFGWFTGYAVGALPFRGPTIGFRAAGLNDLLIDSAYSATRGLVGTALPAAAADAAGGVPISDAGGLDIDKMLLYNDAKSGIVHYGTAQTNTDVDIITFEAGHPIVAGHGGHIAVHITGGTGIGQTRLIQSVTENNGVPDGSWGTAPTSDSTYIVYPAASASVDNPPLVNAEIGWKKNTAINNFPFFMADDDDHVTGKPGLTVTAQRSIDGAAFAACANAVVEVGNGFYKINLAAADLNGDTVAFYFSATGADPVPFSVLTQDI